MSKQVARNPSKRQQWLYEKYGYSVYGFARHLGITANDVRWLIENGHIKTQKSPWFCPTRNINADQIAPAWVALMDCPASSGRGMRFRLALTRKAQQFDENVERECIAAQLGVAL